MLNSIILLGGLVSAFGLGAISPNQEKQDNVQFRLENHKSIQYDDNDQEITFSVNELNNYVWDNLVDTINSISVNTLFSDTSFTYNEQTLSLDEYTASEYLSYAGNDYGIYFDFSSKDFTFDDYNIDNEEYFEYSATWNLPLFSQENYNALKQAIELDIQVNQPSNDNIPQVMSDFIGVLLGGISQLAGGLANGIVAMASALFLATTDGQVTGLSLFGGILAIFAGLAIAVGITTKVYTWVTSLGN